MSECIFCQIAAGRQPAYRVLEDRHTLAFLDIRPAGRGHTLVVPREHSRDLWEISEHAHSEVTAMVYRVAKLLRSTLSPDGLNVKHNTGQAAGQDVLHYHAHVVPRWHGDGLNLTWRPERAPAGELDGVLAQILTRERGIAIGR